MENNTEIPKGAFLAPEPEQYTNEEMYQKYLTCKDKFDIPTIAMICDVDTKDLEEVIKQFESK